MTDDRFAFCSWSGGKDSAMALYGAMMDGYEPKVLLTMMNCDSGFSSSHRLPEVLLQKQAESLRIASIRVFAEWKTYEEVFVKTIATFVDADVKYGIFGDIDLDDHLKWEQKVCAAAGMTAILPLWKRKRRSILDEFLIMGFKAKIVVVNEKFLPDTFLGRDIDDTCIADLELNGSDACGENGEYHTIVYDGPIFHHPIALKAGAILRNSGCAFLEVEA